MPKANTICKYSKCDRGENGGRKHFYACAYCTATEHWKSIACCREHYDLYIQEVLAERAKGADIDTLPDRTDMSKEEVRQLKQKPLSEVKKQTEEELKDYADKNGKVNIDSAVDKVNEKLDGKKKK